MASIFNQLSNLLLGGGSLSAHVNQNSSTSAQSTSNVSEDQASTALQHDHSVSTTQSSTSSTSLTQFHIGSSTSTFSQSHPSEMDSNAVNPFKIVLQLFAGQSNGAVASTSSQAVAVLSQTNAVLWQIKQFVSRLTPAAQVDFAPVVDILQAFFAPNTTNAERFSMLMALKYQLSYLANPLKQRLDVIGESLPALIKAGKEAFCTAKDVHIQRDIQICTLGKINDTEAKDAVEAFWNMITSNGFQVESVLNPLLTLWGQSINGGILGLTQTIVMFSTKKDAWKNLSVNKVIQLGVVNFYRFCIGFHTMFLQSYSQLTQEQKIVVNYFSIMARATFPSLIRVAVKDVAKSQASLQWKIQDFQAKHEGKIQKYQTLANQYQTLATSATDPIVRSSLEKSAEKYSQKLNDAAMFSQHQVFLDFLPGNFEETALDQLFNHPSKQPFFTLLTSVMQTVLNINPKTPDTSDLATSFKEIITQFFMDINKALPNSSSSSSSSNH